MSSRPRSSLVLVLPLVVLACRSPGAGPADPLSVLAAQEELVPHDFESGEVVGISPERVAGRERGDYSLIYVLSEDGSAIETRFRGPSGAVSAGLRVVRKDDGDLRRLVASMPGCEELATLAAWRLDSEGKVADAHVRRTPVAEVRVSELKPGQFIGDRHWRPLERGEPAGAWR